MLTGSIKYVKQGNEEAESMTITDKRFQENCIRKLTEPGTGVFFTSNDNANPRITRPPN